MMLRSSPCRVVLRLVASLGFLAAWLVRPAVARAEDALVPAPAVATVAPAERVRAAVAQGRPLVVHVIVPLCANSQIDCGATWAGKPGDLQKNLYWGAVFGVRQWMERPRSDWERVSVSQGSGARLERRVYRRFVSGTPFGREGKVEQLAVFDAYHGDHIDEALREFFVGSTGVSRVAFDDGGKARTEEVSVMGYTGHNRMLDGSKLPAAPEGERRRPAPAFVLACLSERTFGEPLRAAGVPLLVTTRALVAPEAYLTDAVLHAIGEGKDAAGVREAAIGSYVVWQKLSRGTAGAMF